MTEPARVLVLVADDNPGIRDTTALILLSRGYDVVEAENGEDAMEKMRAAPCDVAVLDVRMPLHDGVWVVENMDPAPPPPGVVMASAYDFDEDTRNRLGSRVLRYLRKPVPPQALLDAVEAAAATGRSA